MEFKLKFGTSGIRDNDENLTNEQIFIATKAFLNYLVSINNIKEKRVALAGDFRPSTNRILQSVASAIIDSGLVVDYCGKIPTPTISHYGFENKIPSIMVTASHNPYGQNGIKFNKTDGEILKNEEQPILNEINKLTENTIISNELTQQAKQSLSNINKQAKELYIQRYKTMFSNILKDIKLIFYQQTAVGRDIIPKILSDLGAEVILEEKLDETKQFIPVDTENLSQEILNKMQSLALKHNCNIVLTADGDSDRPVLTYLENNKLKYLPGDKLNTLVALFLKPDFVAAPITINSKAAQLIQDNNIPIQLTKVGSPHVIQAINNTPPSKDYFLFAFEANGGSLIKSNKKINNIQLNSLLTRDAIFPLICILAFAKSKNLQINELVNQTFSGKYQSFSYSGLVENTTERTTPGCEKYTPEIGKNIINHFKLNDSEIQSNLATKEQQYKINQLQNYFSSLFPLDTTVKLNFLDGIKIYFSNQETIHLRPSGNSAQFRIYAESQTEQRTMQIINQSITPNTGILIKIINNFHHNSSK